MEEKIYPFDFSVVMAVYNVEPFLREAVDSLIAQDFGFEKIQLILVDDGSSDGSGKICDEYGTMYPNNIIVIHKENGGVSSARNEGLKYVQGRYVNFFDSDDKLAENAMSEIFSFFEVYGDKTDIVAIPMIFFDGAEGKHILNNKFDNGNRVIDLYTEPWAVQLSLSSTYIKNEVITTRQFDPNLAYTEDGKLYLILQLDGKATLGVAADTAYWYRRRIDGHKSAIQGSLEKKEFYIPWTKYYCKEVISYCLFKLKYVPNFVQYSIMYDIQWRIKQEKIPGNVLTDQEIAEYLKLLQEIIQYIDDNVIQEQKSIGEEHKHFLLRMKYGQSPDIVLRPDDLLLRYGNTFLLPVSQHICKIEFLKISDGELYLEGYTKVFGLPKDAKIEVGLQVNEEIISCETVKRTRIGTYSLGELIFDGVGFRVRLKLDTALEQYKLSVIMRCQGVDIPKTDLRFGDFSPLSRTYQNSYYISDAWAVRQCGNCLYVNRCGRRGHIIHEWRFLRELWKKNQLGGRKAFFARIAVHLLKLLKWKELWLVSDRIMKADDNGEAFFRYMRDNHREIRTYFVLSKESDDYLRMKKIGPVIDSLSWKHKLLVLLCDYNVSSQGEGNIYNPFPRYSDGVKDILSRKHFVFLQHGVTKDDISDWINRYNKNLYGFVTAARPEYNSIVKGNYSYDEREVWLTGFPRFDRLYHDEKRCVTIMPTWRKYLMGSFNPEIGQWTLDSNFKQSCFCIFYRNLLNNPRLLSEAKRLGYRLRFLPHPNLQPHIEVFESDESVEVFGLDTKYRDIYAQSNLVVTDYSSACFDFAYLRKPIVYCQFDAEEFFKGEHTYTKGYFDYERDGFGEVEYDLESTVDRIIEYMKDGCQLKDKYRERIDSFFAFDDKNNCQRVYERIKDRNLKDGLAGRNLTTG